MALLCQPTVRKYLEGLITNKRKRGQGDEKDNCCDGDDYGACAGATGRCANGGFRAQDWCGGAWQVPCTTWNWCAWRGVFGECWGGLVPQPPWNGCDSSRLNNWGALCVPCGGTGQPICGSSPACNPRHNALGLCFKCGGSGEPVCWEGSSCDVAYRNVFGFCSYSGFSEEPTTNVTDLPDQRQPDGVPVRGIADLHVHQFANLAFGGVMFWGAPFDWRGINSALAWCDYTWDFAT